MKALFNVVATATLLAAAEAYAHGGLVDLSVYDRAEGRQLRVYWHQGRAYVAGRPGNEYQVTLRNRQPEDILAVVSVDGVNVITGQTAAHSQSGYIVAPRGRVDIQGWRKSLSQTAAFYFTALPDSYAARTGRPDDVGVIGVALYRRKALPQPIAPAEMEMEKRRDQAGAASGSLRRESRAAERLGTGHGRNETSHVTFVAFERATDAPAEVITLYYDSHANLLARGIIREPVAPVAPAVPRPFPGFVPDPRG
jgi:hypothetical protein